MPLPTQRALVAYKGRTFTFLFSSLDSSSFKMRPVVCALHKHSTRPVPVKDFIVKFVLNSNYIALCYNLSASEN